MSNSPEKEEQPDSEQGSEKPEILPPELPKNKVQAVLQELEIMAMQKGSRSSLDISKLDKGQIDKLLESISENEKNAFEFHIKRIEAIKEIELKRIDASVINQKTFKVILIGGLLVIIPGISILIFFFKETYFIPWLTFLTGIIGGFGLSKVTSTIFKPKEQKNPIQDDDEKD